MRKEHGKGEHMVVGHRLLYSIIGIASAIGVGAGGIAYAVSTSPANATTHQPPAQPAGFQPNGRIDPNTCIPIYSAAGVNQVQHDAKGNVVCTQFGGPPSGAFGSGG